MLKQSLLFASVVALQASTAHSAELPVRGFPTGDEVLNQRAVPYDQVEPHLVYERNDFDDSIMSPVPPPGVHPRVMMSPEDVPRIRENIKNNGTSKRAWERNVLANVQAKDGSLKPADKARVDFAALYALITDDPAYAAEVVEVIGQKTAEIDQKLDEIDATHAYPQHWWFSVRNTGIKELARAYDYAFNFMNDAQRAATRAVISKATVGRYNHGMELPRSWRTWNWPQFSQDIVNTALAIEGEDGYEPRIFEVCSEAVVDFLTYKISPEGWDFEATGYNGLALGGGGAQSMHAIARRVSPNPLMHPHIQAQAHAYVGQQAGPEGPWWGRGDAGMSAPQFEFTHLMMAFYPENELWKKTWPVSRYQAGLGPEWNERKRLQLRDSLGIPMLLYPVPDDINHLDHWGIDKQYPLTYEAATRGYMATRTNWDPKESVHMSFASYNKLRDTGHDGPDAGTFSIWGHGVNWSKYGDKYNKFSANRSYVAVNGGGMEYGTGPGLFRPVVDQPQATAGRADQTYSFSWKMVNGRYNVLYSQIFEKDPSNYMNQWSRDAAKTLRQHEPDPTPFSKEFWSMASTNYGLWNGEDRHPTRRIQHLPMQRAFRSVSLVRGDSSLNDGHGHPYVLTVDDIQKDKQSHYYTWLMPLDGDVEQVSLTEERDNRATEIVVRQRSDAPLKKGDPVLMVKALQKNHAGFPGIHLNAGRIVIPSVSVAPDFKVLVYPHRHGDPTPITTWNAGKTRLKVEIGKQIDHIDFATAYVDRRPFGGHGEETYYTITRGDEQLITVGGPPSLPRLTTTPGDFTGSTAIAFEPVQPGATIRYTLDGSEPTPSATLYTGPFTIDASTTVKAITYAPDWTFGDAASDAYHELVDIHFFANKPEAYRQVVSEINAKASPPITAVYTQVPPAEPVADSDTKSLGVALSVYELPISVWRGTAIDLESPLMPANLANETPIFRTYQQNLSVTRVQPTVDESSMYQGLYVFSGYFRAETAGNYHFAMRSCGPTRLTVGGKQLIDIPGPYHVRLTEREGDVYLQAGLHRFEAIFADPSFFISPILSVVEFDLKVKTPGALTFTPVQQKQLYRDPDLAFNIADTVLEVGQALRIDNQLEEPLSISIDGGNTYAAYTKPLVFNEVQTVPLRVRRGEDGLILSKPLQVIQRLPALDAVPPLSRGMVRERFILPVTAEFDLDGSHTGGHGKQVIKHPKPTDGDLFELVSNLTPEESVVVQQMLPDRTGGIIRKYSGYWWAPESGVYTFTMNTDGSNKLLIDGVHVTSNHNLDARPEGTVLLEAGWHQLDALYENCYPGITLSGPAGKRALLVSDFKHPADIEEIAYVKDAEGKPESFLLGAWFQKDQVQDDRRMRSERFGAEPVEDEDRPGAYRFSGDQSMILVRELSQTSEDLTLSMWIKPDAFEKNKTQYLWNRQKVGWVYSQRGGAFLRIVGDQIAPGFHGRNRPPKLAQLTPGAWHHIAMTIQSDVPQQRALAELWLNGEKIWSELHPHQLNIPTYYMELFAQVDREHTNLFETQQLGYEDFLENNLLKHSFRGEAADVRLFDAALSVEAIQALADKKQ